MTEAHERRVHIPRDPVDGDISLSAAVLHGDWVSSHDALGRNRP